MPAHRKGLSQEHLGLGPDPDQAELLGLGQDRAHRRARLLRSPVPERLPRLLELIPEGLLEILGHSGGEKVSCDPELRGEKRGGLRRRLAAT